MQMVTKKLVIIIVLICFISGIFLPVTRVNAIWPVFDAVAFQEKILTWIQTLSRWLKEDMMKALRDTVVNTMVDKITDDIVKSIQNGGDPSFVQNWKDYLGDAGDIVFNQLNEKLKDVGADLCSPIAPKLQLSLYYRLNNPYGSFPTTCRFTDFKNNVNNFSNYLETAGWLAYDEMFVPSNNRWGVSILVEDEYKNKTQEEVRARENDALSSNGFLSIKKCRKLGGGYTENSIKEECTDSGGVDSSCVRRVEEEWCEQWDNITPGNSVAESVTSALNLKGKYMTNVQSIISALVNVLITKVLDSAKDGLAGASDSSDTSSTDYGDIDNNTQDDIDALNSSDVTSIKREYEDVIRYLHTVINLIDSDISYISTSACGPTDTITYETDNSTVPPTTVTTTIDSLGAFLLIAKNGMEAALTDAGVNLMDVEEYINNPVSNSILIQILSEYDDFINLYPIVISDVGLNNSGGVGDMVTLYSNIETALDGACLGF